MANYLELKSFFSSETFDSAVKQHLEYNEALINYEEEKNAIQQRFDEKKDLDKESEEYIEAESLYQSQLEGLEKPTYPEYECTVEKYAICVDTLGQDREISETSQEYLA
jgi:hypothetical protein